MKIALDAMGGDFGPKATVKGAVLALKENKEISVILIGKKNEIEKELKKCDYDKNRLEIIHTDENIKVEEGESPARIVKKSPKASMNIALDLVKNGEAIASVSAGNTGALLSASLFKLKRIKGVLRPAITAIMPAKDGYVALVDAGANAECKPQYLEQFAKMGVIYTKVLFEKADPKVGLLNIGEEPGKGNDLSIETYKLLKENKGINFYGNIESRDMMSGLVDVIVTDGFTGNITLKAAEGVATFVLDLLKEAIKSSFVAKIGAFFMLPALKKMKERMDYSEYGGAIFLGVNGISIKSHGSSDENAIKNGIKIAHRFAEKKIIVQLQEDFKKKEGEE
ncbi:MAG: phosphate--acyl-ACP acyltransferase [Fusobacteriia bacterium 4572_132]|nr:MAG: phosphate--acyl-ACP acyltransferase [Fusobacteriia bacterium 4572_132]